MRALVVVDVQKDFCEGGSLAVTGGAAVAAAITRHLDGPAASQYAHVVATKDHHVDPGSHFSADPDYVGSWPAHCVAGTPGAEFHPDLAASRFDEVFRKGEHAAAYSGFEGLSSRGETLADWLSARDVAELDVAGIATDYCVRATVADAVRLGFAVRVLTDLTAGVSVASSVEAEREMRSSGAQLMRTASMSELLGGLQEQSFGRATAATRASYPPERRLTGAQLASYLDRRKFAVVGSGRADGRPHAAMSVYVRRGTTFWLPTMAGSVRERNLRGTPWLTMVVAEGDHPVHIAVIAEGPAENVELSRVPEDVLAAVTADWASAWIRVTAERLLSYADENAPL